MNKCQVAEWHLSTISKHARITTGSKDTQNKVDNGKHPFFVRSQKVERIDSYAFDGEGVLTAGDGVGTGKVFHYVCGKFDYHQRVYLISDFDDNLNGKFFYYYFSENFLKQVQKLSAKGSVDSVRMEMIAGMPLPLPSLPEQQKIAAILSSVDDVIEKTRAQINKLKDLKTGMMQELLTKGIGHTEFKNSPVGRIPVNWEITNLGSIVIPKGLQTGPFGSQLHAHEYVERGVPVVMPKDMKINRIDPASIAHIPEARAAQLEKHRVRKGDLLFARRGDIGRFALVEQVNDGWICGTGCLKARLSTRINPIFISCYLTLTTVIEWLNLNAVGQTMLNLNTSILAELPIILPPEKEQKIIGDAISALDSRISSNRRKLASVENTKKALMQDLLTGKVRVKIDEKEKESAVA